MKIVQSVLTLSAVASQFLNSSAAKIKVGQFFNKTDGQCQNFVNMSSATTLNQESKSYVEAITGLELKAVIKMDKEDFKASEKEGNCYNFATSTTSEVYSSGRIPGGIPLGRNFDCEIIHAAMLQNPSMRSKELSAGCGTNEREIFLFVGDSESGQSDFHFVVADEDGTYYHKQGRMPASIAPSNFIEDGLISEKQTAIILTSKDSTNTELLFDDGDYIAYKLCPEKYCYDIPHLLPKHNEL